MFRIEFFCDDKRVGEVLRLIGTVGAYDVKAVPVVNAEKQTNGTVKARINGGVVEMLSDYIKSHKLKTITPDHMRDFQRSIGRAPGGYSHALALAMKVGLLRKNDASNRKGTTYEVLS